VLIDGGLGRRGVLGGGRLAGRAGTHRAAGGGGRARRAGHAHALRPRRAGRPGPGGLGRVDRDAPRRSGGLSPRPDLPQRRTGRWPWRRSSLRGPGCASPAEGPAGRRWAPPEQWEKFHHESHTAPTGLLTDGGAGRRARLEAPAPCTTPGHTPRAPVLRGRAVAPGCSPVTTCCPRITPNISVQRGAPPDTLGDYLDSLARTPGTSTVDEVLPGATSGGSRGPARGGPTPIAGPPTSGGSPNCSPRSRRRPGLHPLAAGPGDLNLVPAPGTSTAARCGSSAVTETAGGTRPHLLEAAAALVDREPGPRPPRVHGEMAFNDGHRSTSPAPGRSAAGGRGARPGASTGAAVARSAPAPVRPAGQRPPRVITTHAMM